MLTETLLPLLRPLIGIRPDPLDNYEAESLPESLMKTTTGLTLDQCHDLLQLSTLRKTGPLEVVDFPAYLSRVRDNAIRALLTSLDTRLVEAGLSPRLLKPTAAFTGSFGLVPPLLKSGRTVGLRLQPTQTDVTLSLDRLTVFGFMEVQGLSLTLTEEETGKTTSIQVPSGGTWHDVFLPIRTGYTYTLTYNEDDLGANNFASNTVTQWPKPAKGCKGCKGSCLSSYVRIDGIANGVTNQTNNFGVNVVLSATGDVTGRLADDPRRLITALRQQMAVTFLEQIAYSTRKNGPTEEAKQGALFALTDKDNADRVTLKLDRSLSALTKALSAEASSALDTNTDDEITWGSL